jgi:hypothetical protein
MNPTKRKESQYTCSEHDVRWCVLPASSNSTHTEKDKNKELHIW